MRLRNRRNKNSTTVKSRISLRFRISIAMIFMSLIPGLLLTFIYFGNIKEFYRDKIEVYQLNTLNMMKSKMEYIVNQGKIASDQVLGLTVNSSLFGNYDDMNSYQRLVLYRNVNSLLSNIRVSNDSIDNIYMIGFDGNYYTSNPGWNREEFLKNSWITAKDKKYSGYLMTIPTHTAAYKYSSADSGTPLVVSLVSFLNRNTDNRAISLVQIDISYQKINEAMDYMEITQQDEAFIVDKDRNVIYTPDKSLAGKSAGKISIAGKSFNVIMDKLGSRDEVRLDTLTIRRCPIKGSNWDIIQINSDEMLKQEISKFKSIWATISIVCMVIAGIIALSLSMGITRPISKLIKSMKKVSHGDFNTKVEVVADKDLAELVDSFNIMILEVDKLIKENLQKERDRLTMELTALNSQINSHFLYNTLNAMKWMAVRKGENDIARMIVSLVNMLEYSCKNVDIPVPIPEEIQFIKDYLYIQEIRYKNHIDIEYTLDEELENCMILKILLQPIVENAILHGFGNESRDNRISIQGRIHADCVKIQIRDNGRGFHYKGFDKLTGIGLYNIQDRLKLNYGEGYDITIESEIGAGTCVTLVIPIVRKAEATEDENIGS